MKPCKILPIGDVHARPGVDNRRADWLGDFIVDTQPDYVVDMGDLSDFPSLSSYDGSRLVGGGGGKKQFEGRRYNKDVEAGVEFRDRVKRKIKGMRKKPKFFSLGGNHDYERIMRAIDHVPELDGTISIADQQHAEMGWEFVPFLEPLEIAGITFQHFFGSGLMQRAIGGENCAVTLLKTQFKSSGQGHNHLFSMAIRTRSDGQKLQAWTFGCYLDPDQWEKYAGRSNKLWDRGLALLEDVENGYAQKHSWTGVDWLRRTYG